MNIQFTNWQAIHLQVFSSSFGGIQSNLTEVDSVLGGLSTQFIDIYDGNNNVGYGYWGGYDLTVRGSGFVASANPVATSVSLVDPFRTYSFGGAINVTNNFAGFYGITGGTFTSVTTLFKDSAIPSSDYSYSVKGNLIYSSLGRIDGGTISSVTTSDNRFSLKGNLNIDANEVVTGGIINEITYKSPTGESFTVNNASIPYLTFVSFIPNDPLSIDFAPVINYLTSSTILSGNDRITADAQNNTLDGAAGIDTLIGGLGNDTYKVDLVQTGTTAATFRVALQDTVTEALNAGNDDTLELRELTGNLVHLNATTLTLGANLENLDASQTGFTKLNLTGNALNNTLTGNAADNILLGSTGDDELNGGAGNDTLDGGVGSDTLTGGIGNDTYLVDIKAAGITPNISVELQDSIVEINGTADGIDTLKLRGSVVIPAATAATNIALAGNLANIENLDVSLTGATRLNLTGNDANNTLIGNATVNTLIGGDGDDTLNGGAGLDILVGGIGNDTYIVDSLAEANAIVDDDGSNTLNIGLAYTLTNASPFTNITLSGAGAISATGNDFANELTGNAAANILNGGLGDDKLFGGAGADTLNGGAGEDDMEGGDGNDTYIVDDENDTVTETNAVLATGGTDLVKSSISFDLNNNINVENLTLTGTDDDLVAYGNSLANVITGNSGRNILYGYGGKDTLIGGAGNDGYQVDLKLTGIEGTATASVSLEDTIIEATAISGGYDAIQLFGNYNLTKASTITLAVGLEALDAQFTDNTLLNLVGNAADNGIQGNNANNLIKGGAGNDILDGGAGDDIINGETGDDLVFGGSGNDILDGGIGFDTLEGGDGNDTYLVDFVAFKDGTSTYARTQDLINPDSTGNDTVVFRGAIANSAYQTYYFGVPSFENYDFSTFENFDFSATGTTKINIEGNDANNILIGNAAINTLIGGDGDDTLNGGAGLDILIGGVGNDTYIVDSLAEANAIIDSDGDNTLNIGLAYTLTNASPFTNITLSGVGAVSATGNDNDNTLTGNAATNVLNGGLGNDELYGGAGADTLNGGADNDTLKGGTGNDVLTGGLGVDTFVWELADKGTNGRPAIDKITDFDTVPAGDKLDLRDLLVGESSGNILNYLDVTTSLTAGITNTEIRISNTGGFTSGNYSAAAENQHFTLAGVNLFTATGTGTEADLLATLITQNKLIIDV